MNRPLVVAPCLISVLALALPSLARNDPGQRPSTGVTDAAPPALSEVEGLAGRADMAQERSMIRGKDGAPMVFVPAGDFLMGSTDRDKEAGPEEKPQHKVSLDGYYIDQHEVTVAQYREFLKAVMGQGHGRCAAAEPENHDHTPGWWTDARWTVPEQPVVGVDWYDAYAYCAWAGERLPTEAEWERAARGTDGRIYPWGNEYDGKRANGANVVGRTTTVGSYPSGASPYGALDMAGNVREWIQDFYDENYYKGSPAENPPGGASGQYRVMRGGSWIGPPMYLRSTARGWDGATDRYNYYGFRCVQGQDALAPPGR